MDYCQPIHASAFSFHGAGCLLIGDSGTGKSRLVAEALLHGAHIIADDQVRLCALNGNLVASAAPQLEGVIELRGFGLVKCKDAIHSHPIHLIVELSTDADTRIPEKQTRDYLGVHVPYVKVLPVPELSVATLLLFLKAMMDGRTLDAEWRPQR